MSKNGGRGVGGGNGGNGFWLLNQVVFITKFGNHPPKSSPRPLLPPPPLPSCKTPPSECVCVLLLILMFGLLVCAYEKRVHTDPGAMAPHFSTEARCRNAARLHVCSSSRPLVPAPIFLQGHQQQPSPSPLSLLLPPAAQNMPVAAFPASSNHS